MWEGGGFIESYICRVCVYVRAYMSWHGRIESCFENAGQHCRSHFYCWNDQRIVLFIVRRKCITLQKALMDTENKLASTIKEMEDRIQMGECV